MPRVQLSHAGRGEIEDVHIEGLGVLMWSNITTSVSKSFVVSSKLTQASDFSKESKTMRTNFPDLAVMGYL